MTWQPRRLGWMLLVLLAGCRSAPTVVAPSGRLTLQVQPITASVLIDDRLLPRQSDGGLRAALTPGPHRVEVYAPGYFHAYKDVVLSAAKESALAVALRPDPDAQLEGAPVGGAAAVAAPPLVPSP